jgi:hypothetical protein
VGPQRNGDRWSATRPVRGHGGARDCIDGQSPPVGDLERGKEGGAEGLTGGSPLSGSSSTSRARPGETSGAPIGNGAGQCCQ